MKKILFIDDNRDLLTATVEALELHGFLATGADNAKDALGAIKVQKPDLILCDIMMPELNGYDVIKYLKSDPVTSLIPFIFLTAQADQADLRRGMEVGADDYLVKPVRLETLVKAIHSRLQKSEEINSLVKTRLDELRNKVFHLLPHEMLTPLHGILGFSNIILENAQSLTRQEINDLVSSIEVSGTRLHDLINNYLRYVSQSLRNDDKSNFVQICKIHKIIEEVTSKVASKYNRIEDLVIKIEDVPIQIELDDFEFMIRELVDNAFKFSKKDTIVGVMNSFANGNMELVITDNGMGFPLENMSEIGAFNQFNRKTQEQQGAGLGLITSMLIAQRYKGSILIKNDKSGTVVYLKLPLEAN